MRCLLVGNYGVANLGDEALKEYFLHAFPDIDWVVVSASPSKPQEVPRLPGGLRSLVSTPWWKTIGEIRRCDAMVFGGGTLFTDVESVYACFLWAIHAFTAIVFGKPVILASQGVGPFKGRVGEWITRAVASKCAFASVRDKGSLQRVQSWGLSTKIVQTYDPVFSFMISRKFSKSTKNVFIIIPRHNSDDSLVEQAANSYKMYGSGQPIKILLMQPNDPGELSVAGRLSAGLGGGVSVLPVLTVDDLMKEIADASYIVTQRFHGALAALAADTPVEIVPQKEGDKLSQLIGQTDADRAHALELTAAGEQALRMTLEEIASNKA